MILIYCQIFIRSYPFDYNQTGMNFVHLFTISLLVTMGTSLTTIPTFNITNKYIETGTYMLATTVFFGNTSWVGVKQTTFEFLLQRAHPSYRSNVVFQDLDFLLTSTFEYNVSIAVCVPFSTTKLTICLSSANLNKINAFRLRYILLDSGFSKTAMYSLNVYGSTTQALNSATPYVALFGLPAVNMTGTMKVFVAWKGFNVTAPDSNLQIDLKATGSFTDSTTLQLVIETTVTGNIILGGAFLSFFGYNVEETAAWPFPAAKLNYATFAGSNSTTAVYTDSNSLTRDYNTFWGLTRLNFNNQPSIKFTSDLTVSTSIQGTSSVSFNNLEYVVLVFQFKQCDSTTPYYMMSTDICYDICPPRYYGDAQFLCQPCTNYDCYQCTSSGSCTVCSNSTDFRVMNLTSNRCIAMPGYFDEGTNNSLAKPCNSNCKECRTTAIFCTACFDGFFLDTSNICTPCMSNCKICSTSTSCTTCNTYYSFDTNSNTCQSNINCSAIANCTTCNISTGCTQCVSGYNATNITACSPVCGDGIKLSFEACDDSNSANGDGCSPTCTIQPAYYCIFNGVGSICNNCSIHCTQCTAANNCQSCASPYLLANATKTCGPDCNSISLCLSCHEPIGTNLTICDSCSVGYAPLNNTCRPKCGDAIVLSPTQQCDDGNTLNGDGCSSTCTFQPNSACTILSNKSICTFCPSKKYADSNHTMCLNCNYDCGTCDSTGCLTCSSLAHRKLDNTTHKCIPIDGFYDDTTNQVAPPCSLDCLTCNGGNNNNCLACDSSKVLNSNKTCSPCSLTAGIGCSSCAINSSTSSITCLNCSSGNLDNGSCLALPSLPENMLPKLLLMILLPLLLALCCCCCCIIFCIWRRRKHQQNKVQEEDEKNIQNPSNQTKKYKVDSKKLDGKIEINETEVNQLSMNEFKGINDIKVEVLKEKSEVNYDMESSEKSDFSKSAEDDEEGNKGCNY